MRRLADGSTVETRSRRLRRRRVLIAATAVVAVAASLWMGADGSEPPSPRPEHARGVIGSVGGTDGGAGGGSPVSQAAAAPSEPSVDCAEGRSLADPASRGLTDLDMVSPNKGFAVGEGVILVTDDGHHWQQRYSDEDWFVSVEALDVDHAWVVGQHSLLATADGGHHWTPVSEPRGASLRAVDFVDPSTGWGSDGRHVYRTTDGGESWVAADPPCGAERICFSARDDGWAARDRHVFRTTDGGHVWTAAFTLPIRETDNQFNAKSVQIDGLDCAAPGVVWVSFAGSAAGTTQTPYVIYRGSGDGAWAPVLQAAGGPPPSAAAPTGGTYPAPFHAVDRDTAVYVSFTPTATPSAALTTGQGGSMPGPWHSIPGLFSITSLSFPEQTTGWVLAPKAGATNIDVILATTDGGRTWQEQFTRAVPPPSA